MDDGFSAGIPDRDLYQAVPALTVGGPRTGGASASLRRSSAIATSAEQPPLVGAARVISGDHHIPLLHHPLAHEAASLIQPPFGLAFVSLKIFTPDEVPALDLGADALGQFKVIEANTPLRHAHDRVLCLSQIAHGLAFHSSSARLGSWYFGSSSGASSRLSSAICGTEILFLRIHSIRCS